MSAHYFTVEGLAKLYQIPRTTVWKMIREGKFRRVLKVGKKYRIPEESRIEFEKQNTIHAK